MSTVNLYALEVWKAHVQKSNVHALASSAEWALMTRWAETVPLRVTLRAIEDTVTKPKTLMYYDRPVQEAYERWRRSMVS